MSKVIVPILIGAALIGAAFLTGGVSLVTSATLLGAGGYVSAGVTTLVTAGGFLGTVGSTLLLAGGSMILQGVAAGVRGTPKPSAAQLGRLNPSLVPAAPRKIVLGQTALALDARYIEPSGTSQEYFDYIIAVASHAVQSIDEMWFEDRPAWTVGGGIDAFYAGSLVTVDIRLEGTAANAITVNAGARWSSANCRLTGCAYVHIRIKRTGTTAKADNPLSGGLPGRVTIIGKGAKVYDPRRDSTNGGSGAHRPNDQTTWEYANGGTDLGNNHALQALWYLLGWKIGGKLAVGKGIPAARIDMASFIAGANLCDEAITLAAGGTQRRYEGAGVFSEADAPLTVLDTTCTSCNASITDTSGRLGIEVSHNDLSGSIVTFTDDDIIGEFAYDPSPSLHETINIVRGRFTDPSTNSLYQMIDFPEVSITSPDGIARAASIDLPMVQEGRRAQRIAKQMLQRAQYGGVYTAPFGIRALGVKRGQVVKLTFAALGFTNKLFRVQSQTIVVNSGHVQMVLREEDPAIHAWAADERAVVTPSAPVLFDPRNDPLATIQGTDIGVSNGADVTSAAQVSVSVMTLQAYDADYTGALIGTLAPVSVLVSKGGTSIKLDNNTSYTITNSAGITATIDNTNGSGTKGDITPTALTGNYATTDIVVTVSGVAQPKQTIVWTKTLGAVPSTGGTGTKTASDPAPVSLTATSYAAISATLWVTLASGESLYGTAPLDYDLSGTTGGIRTATAKWQYSTHGAGSWSDFTGTPPTGSNAICGHYVSGEWIDPTIGHIDVTQSKSGLSAGDYDVRLVAQESSSGRTMYFYGSATVQAKV